MESVPSRLISDHPPRHARLYAFKRRLTAIGLIGCAIALAGELLLMATGLPGISILPLLVIFTIGLALPLLVAPVLNPPVSATEEGLIVRPMFGPARLVLWEAIRVLRPHTLIPVDRSMERLLLGRRRVGGQDGRWIVVVGGLPLQFRLVAWLTGMGNVAVFGISDASHQGYTDLLSAIERHTGLTI